MKIGIVAFICNCHSGARAPIELAIALRKINEAVYFFSFDLNKDQEAIGLLEKARVNVILIRKSSIPLFGNFIDAYNFFVKLKNTPLDVLTTHATLSLTLASVSTGKPVLGCYYGTQFNVLKERFSKNNLSSYLDLILNILIFLKSFLIVKLPTKLVSISKYCQEETSKLYGRKSELVYLGAKPHNFIYKDLKRAKKQLICLSVSRITPYKQFDKIISVFRTIKASHTKLIIAGSSPQKKYLTYLKKEAKISVEILVSPDDKKLNSLYQNCDIYLSADKYLFFGLPILEAASFGKPAISLNYAAAKEIVVHKKTGFVAKDLEEFKKYLLILIDNHLLRAKMGQAAKKHAQKFSWERCAKNYQKILHSMSLS